MHFCLRNVQHATGLEVRELQRLPPTARLGRCQSRGSSRESARYQKCAHVLQQASSAYTIHEILQPRAIVHQYSSQCASFYIVYFGLSKWDKAAFPVSWQISFGANSRCADRSNRESRNNYQWSFGKRWL